MFSPPKRAMDDIVPDTQECARKTTETVLRVLRARHGESEKRGVWPQTLPSVLFSLKPPISTFGPF